MAKDKYQGVFDAHPEVKELHVGKDAFGEEQCFIRKGEALNFAKGKEENVETIKRPGTEKPAEAKPEKAKKEAEEGK